MGSTPHISWKMGGSGGSFFGKIRHNKQKLSINLTFFPFSFDQMFINSSMHVCLIITSLITYF